MAAGLGSHTSGTELLTLLIRLSSGDANQLRQTWALPACLVCWAALPATAWQLERPPVTRACEQSALIRWAAGDRTFSSWAVAKAEERWTALSTGVKRIRLGDGGRKEEAQGQFTTCAGSSSRPLPSPRIVWRDWEVPQREPNHPFHSGPTPAASRGHPAPTQPLI